MRCPNSRLVTVFLSFLVLLWAVSCGDDIEQPIPVPSTHEDGVELVIGWHELTENEDWMESTAISAPNGASRIGMMLDLEIENLDLKAQAQVEMRGFDQEGKPLPWTAAEVTFAQDYTVVARLDPGQTVFGAQLRLPHSMSSQVKHLTFTAVVPEPPGAESEAAGDQPAKLGHTKGALSLSQIVKPRSSWNAKASLCTSSDPNKSKMAIHHTYSPPSSAGGYAARIRGIQAYHMDVRGWCDIGYHYLVTQDGSVWEGRPIKRRGAHVGGHNTGNIGVSYVGCFQSGACNSMGNVVPSEVSVNAGAALVSALSTKYGIAKNKSKVKGHMQHPGASTTCPGDNLLSRLGDIISVPANNPNPRVVPGSGGNADPPANPPANPEPNTPKGKLSGVIWNAESSNSPTGPTAQIISNASVSVLGVGAVPVKPQDAYWEFVLEPGVYTLVGSAPGYQSYEKIVVVSSNNTTWSSLGLTPQNSTIVVPEPPPTPNTNPGPNTVCYPGQFNTWDVCFELTPKSQVGSSGYSYPSGGPSGQYKAPKYLLNLSGLNPATRLSKNFILDEFMQSYKGKYAIYSPQTVVHWQNIRTALGVPIYINSGFRSPGYNAGVEGAAKFSRHMYGDAADVTAKGAVSLSAIKNKCQSEGADYVSVYTSHVHCDWRNDALKDFWSGFGAGKPGAHSHHGESMESRAWVHVSNSTPVPGSAVFLKAHYEGFEEGIPWVRWHIAGPQFTRTVEARQTLAFVPREIGTYVVSWEVAGYLLGSETIIAR